MENEKEDDHCCRRESGVAAVDYSVCVWCIWEDGCSDMENVLIL